MEIVNFETEFEELIEDLAMDWQNEVIEIIDLTGSDPEIIDLTGEYEETELEIASESETETEIICFCCRDEIQEDDIGWECPFCDTFCCVNLWCASVLRRQKVKDEPGFIKCPQCRNSIEFIEQRKRIIM